MQELHRGTVGAEYSASTVRTVAIIGAGSIGIAWAVVFASAGVRVRIYEALEQVREAALPALEQKLKDLEAAGLADASPAVVASRVTVHDTLAESVADADYVQECIVEDLEAKRQLFKDLDRLTAHDVVLASSTSTIPASEFAAGLSRKHRCIVVHPGNPPYFLRVAEIVPASFTAPATIETTKSFLAAIGIAPILLNKEIEGFAFNRLQGALLREAYCLVRDGIVSPADIDTLVREGLGLRWSVIGPFTTSELNTRGGIRRHSTLLGPIYARLGIERADENPWTTETIERVATEIESQLPHATWEENVAERDRVMIQFSSLIKHFSNPLSRNPHSLEQHAAGLAQLGAPLEPSAGLAT